MMRRLHLAMIMLVICASTAWPKWKEEDQKYLDSQFQAIQEQVQALKTQMETLNATIAELRQNQAQLQAAMVRQIRVLQDTEQLISSMRTGGDENFSTLKLAVSQLRAETQKSFGTLLGQPVQTFPGSTEAAVMPRGIGAAPATPQATQGYITVVDGNSVTVDLGSARGIRSGSRLVIYKAGDPNTRVGVLEVTQVLDADNSKGRIVTMNAGVRPEFSDIVRLE